MTNTVIRFMIAFLLVFTPVMFGAMDVWAFSMMELCILLIIIMTCLRFLINRGSPDGKYGNSNPQAFLLSQLKISILLLFLFFCIILMQMIPLPLSLIKTLSPRTYEIRQGLQTFNIQVQSATLSFVPFLTQIEFYKWLTLSAFFFFLLCWKVPNQKIISLLPVIILVGIGESLYGMFEFFSGHRQIFGLAIGDAAGGVTGTFINRNYFAGYLLMVIPLSVGYFFSREAFQMTRFIGWRNRLTSLDGKTLLIAFGIILMILGLIFSASRMGIVSLLLSFTIISFLFKESWKGQRFSKAIILIFGLAFLWAIWIGLDAVISRFFAASEDFGSRWNIWMDTIQVFKDFPLFGSGLGTFVCMYPFYRSVHFQGYRTHAENDYVQLLSEIGLIGAGLLLIILLYLLYKSIVRIRSLSSRGKGKYIGTAGLVGILALMFHSIVERNIQVPSNAFLFTFIFALILRVGVNRNGVK